MKHRINTDKPGPPVLIIIFLVLLTALFGCVSLIAFVLLAAVKERS